MVIDPTASLKMETSSRISLKWRKLSSEKEVGFEVALLVRELRLLVNELECGSFVWNTSLRDGFGLRR